MNGNDTYLGHKWGHDSLLSDQVEAYKRLLADDGFDPTKVIAFTVNSSGPYVGTKGRPGAGAPMKIDVEPGTELDPDTFNGTIAIIKRYDNKRNYIYYTYDDGRPNSGNRDGGGSGFGLAWEPPGHPTDVDETMADNLGDLTVVSERYFDASGAEHSEPVAGVNIIVRQMSDGSTQTTKVIK